MTIISLAYEGPPPYTETDPTSHMRDARLSGWTRHPMERAQMPTAHRPPPYSELDPALLRNSRLHDSARVSGRRSRRELHEERLRNMVANARPYELPTVVPVRPRPGPNLQEDRLTVCEKTCLYVVLFVVLLAVLIGAVAFAAVGAIQVVQYGQGHLFFILGVLVLIVACVKFWCV